MQVLFRHRFGDAVGARVIDVVVTYLRDGGALAAAHAGCAQDPDLRAKALGKLLEQRIRALHLAGDGVADAHRDRRGRRLAVQHDVEMGVEGGDLVDLGHGRVDQRAERLQMAGGEMAHAILHQMQILDQAVAAQRLLRLQQGGHFGQGCIFLLAPLGEARLEAASRSWGNAAVYAAAADGVVHGHASLHFPARWAVFRLLSVVLGVHDLQRHPAAVDQDLARVLEIHRDPVADRRLHLSQAPVGLLGVLHDGARNQIHRLSLPHEFQAFRAVSL